MSFLRASLTVGSLTLLSRILGFVRDILTAAFLGAGPVADAFFVALKLPNFFRRITAEGAFSVSFIPIFSRTLKQEGDKAALTFAGRALSWMLLILIVFSILAIIFMPTVVGLIAPGFIDDPMRYDLAIALTRITFGYLTFMSVVALMGGVLNSYDVFAPFAGAPILFNLSLIGALVFLTQYTQTPAHALAYGVFIAGILQFLWMALSLKRAGIKLTLKKPELSQKMAKLFKLMGPGIFGAGVVQVNVFVDMILASLLPVGAVSYLYYADRLGQLPLGVIGVTMGTALLPKLTKALSGKPSDEANILFNKALEYSLLLGLPAAVALVVIPNQLVSVLFERGAFNSNAAIATAHTVLAYAVGLPAFVGIKVFASTFYAHEDTKTPVKIAMLGAITNIVLSLILIRSMAHVGIALATSIAAWVQVICLYSAMRRYDGLRLTKTLLNKMIRIALASAAMGGALYFMSDMLNAYFTGTQGSKILGLIILVGTGKAVYAVAVLAMRAVTYQEIKTALKG